MLSVGIDLVEIRNIEKSMKNPLFLQRVFGDKELDDLNSKTDRGKLQSAAAYFAAKEAFSKALGTGIRGFKLSDVQVVHNSLGAPYFVFSNEAAVLATKKEFSLSITHTDNYAAAFVVANERSDGK
ncbi:MAG: holo-ACP synthase [Oscillospiraceae bacterium]